MKKQYIKEIIETIHKDSKRYLSEEKVVNINSLLFGYNALLNQMGYSQKYDYLFHYKYSKWLESWIINNIDKEYNMNSFFWSVMIKQIVDDEEKALNLFYETSSLFFKECKKNKNMEQLARELMKRGIKNRNIVFENNYVEKMLVRIKHRAGMFIIEKNVSCLFHFLSGCLMALEYVEDKMNESDKAFQNKFSSWLDQWIRENKDSEWNEKTVYWDKTLEKITDNEEEAFNLFFDLSEQFFKDFHEGKVSA